METARAPQALWPVLAPLDPCLTPDAVVSIQHFRGVPWYVVSDRASGEVYRLAAGMEVVLVPDLAGTPLADRVAARYPQADEAFLEQLAVATVRLYRTGLLELEPSASVPEVLQALRTSRAPASRLNPLAIRIPLLDPDHVLDRVRPLGRAIFSAPSLFLLVIIVAGFGVLGLMHANAIGNDLLSKIETPTSWIGFALCYVVLKAFHETAHALAVKRWDGHVHDMGLLLLVFFPVPYVDASASTSFTDKYQRIAVAGAGIAAELFAAGIALLLWLNTEPGLVHTLSFNVVVIGGVSTLLFNGNPLMRFDAYYALSDLLEIPNLYTRSRSHLNFLVLHYLFQARDLRSSAATPAEGRWLLAYGLASVVYRASVLLAIAFFLSTKLFFVGVALAVWVVVTEFARPCLRFIAELRRLDTLSRARFGFVARGAAGLATILAFVTLVPLPQATVAVGVVAVSEDAQVRAGSNGFIQHIEAHVGDELAVGSTVMTLSNAELVRDLAAARARVLEQDALRTAAAVLDRVAARAIEDSLIASRRTEAEIAERVQQLTVRSPLKGRFVAADLDELEGSYVERGDTLGYITDPEHFIVRIVIPENRMDLFQRPARSIALRFAEAPELRVEAQPAGTVPASLLRLPSAALGSHGGGPIAVDPSDPDGLTPLVNVFQLDLKPLSRVDQVGVSGRAEARFEHAPEPLLPRAVRAARRLFLAKFSS